MHYAIIQLAGKQFKVSPDQELIVDQISDQAAKSLKVTDVLLVVDGDKVQVGNPLVKGASVLCEVDRHQKSKKIRVAKYKSKSRYRRTYGHRQSQTVLKVKSIVS